jgi:hypothetical protein
VLFHNNTNNKESQNMLKKILLDSIIAISSITSSFAAIVHINQADAPTFAENLIGIGMIRLKPLLSIVKIMVYLKLLMI